MKYFLYIPGMELDGDTISSNRSLGGSESAGFYVARELTKRGHSVTIFSNCRVDSIIDKVHYVPLNQSEQDPIGRSFLEHVTKVPHDVLIVQRSLQALQFRTEAKINLWWTHDLALFRYVSAMNTQLWNIDGILGVSEFHCKQIQETYGVSKELTSVLPNGVDFDLYKNQKLPEDKIKSRVMIYSSRPERGLGFLVAPGGIMEKLQERAPEIILRVTGYDHMTRETQSIYQELWERCRLLKNVDLLGPLSKKELAALQSSSWLHVYPSKFEETSCITAMEQQVAGTPFIGCNIGALPETLKNAGSILIDSEEDIIKGFVREILALNSNDEKWHKLHKKALEKSQVYSWKKSVDALEKRVDKIFRKKTENSVNLGRHFAERSDLAPLKILINKDIRALGSKQADSFIDGLEYLKNENEFIEIYEGEAKKSVERNKNATLKTIASADTRMSSWALMFGFVEAQIGKGRKRILDYGCGLGHGLRVAARKYPGVEFVGADISKIATDWASKEGEKDDSKNLKFFHVRSPKDLEGQTFDAIACTEVIEHNPEPWKIVEELEGLLEVKGKIFLTFPFGPMDLTEGFGRPQLHINHFEYEDIFSLWGNRDHLSINQGYWEDLRGRRNDAIGNQLIMWEKGEEKKTGEIDYEKKLLHQSPRETLSTCMIVGAEGGTLRKTLESVKIFTDELIIAIDSGERDFRETNAYKIAQDFGAISFHGESPLNIGFGEARNRTIDLASCNWILWIDDDETMLWGERVEKYLRNNCYTGYSVKQHHYAVEPAGLLKTDFPCRIFRNLPEMCFYGVVHEHPERNKPNDGPGKVVLLPDIAICHNGYETEQIRRTRFSRNIGLMHRDQKEFPTRIIGKFLWLRDLVYMNQYDIERKNLGPHLKDRVEEVFKLWRWLVEEKHVGNAIDSLPYYSQAVRMLLGEGIKASFEINASWMGISNGLGGGKIEGNFATAEDLNNLIAALAKEKTGIFDNKYF